MINREKKIVENNREATGVQQRFRNMSAWISKFVAYLAIAEQIPSDSGDTTEETQRKRFEAAVESFNKFQESQSSSKTKWDANKLACLRVLEKCSKWQAHYRQKAMTPPSKTATISEYVNEDENTHDIGTCSYY